MQWAQKIIFSCYNGLNFYSSSKTIWMHAINVCLNIFYGNWILNCRYKLEQLKWLKLNLTTFWPWFLNNSRESFGFLFDELFIPNIYFHKKINRRCKKSFKGITIKTKNHPVLASIFVYTRTPQNMDRFLLNQIPLEISQKKFQHF